MSHRYFLLLATIGSLASVAADVSAQTAPAPSAPAAAYVAPYQGPGYVPPPPPPPPQMLGINMEVAYINYGGRWEPGLKVVNVWPGYPAYGLLDPGDIITRVNGMRVRNVPEFRNAMAYSGPYVHLRLWNVRTGYIQDIQPIWLGGPGGYPGGYGAPAAAAPSPAAAPGAAAGSP